VPVNNFLRPSMAQAVGYQPLTQRPGWVLVESVAELHRENFVLMNK
jgi:hypothetical protein